MARALPVLALALGVLAAGCTLPEAPEAPAEPTPEPPPPPPPPPPEEGSVEVAVNDTWRYRGDAGNTTVRVASVRDGVVRLQATTDGARGGSVTTLVDERTLAVLALVDDRVGVEVRFDPPLPILVPATNHTYEGRIVVPTFLGSLSQPATGEVRFHGLENVTVPAGTFQAYRYEATIESKGAVAFSQTREIWFAPEVEQAVRSVTDGRVEELVSYDLSGT